MFWDKSGRLTALKATRSTVRPAILGGVAVVAMFLAACGGGSGDHGSVPGTAGTRPGPVNETDVLFAQNMILHHRQAIDMSGLAQTGASDPEVKKLAEQIRAAQQPEIGTMSGWLTSWGKQVPEPRMSGETDQGMSHGRVPGMMSHADMNKLKGASGKEFDKKFLSMMVSHHEGAITMAETELASGSNAGAKALARQIIATQHAEIDTMNKVRARL